LRDGREIFLEAADVYEGLLRKSSEFKLIGITVAGLRPYVNQLSLFGDAERQKCLTSALDKINDKYGEFTILRAKMMSAGRVLGIPSALAGSRSWGKFDQKLFKGYNN